MKVPLSWVKDFVDISLSVEDLARRLTLAGLNVEEIEYVGLPMPDGRAELQKNGSRTGAKISGLEWDPEKIVVAEVLEVMPHPNADRLVLCRLNDGQQEHIVLTGAPNLYPYKGQGALNPTLKVAYAKEGARLYDGHQPGQVLTTLKRAKIRGVESYSMICSEKELGISDEHEGVILLDSDAPVGMPLVEYMGDAVFEIEITPNIARDANMLGVAREIAAITGQPLRQPNYELQADGEPVEGQAAIEILNPELNPRFVLGLVKEVKIHPSSYTVQRRLRLAGMRPINNIVDATNYVMLEAGQPLHAFDYDVLVQRAGGPPTILTRTAKPGEHLTTLDGVERTLNDFTVLVCDTAGALSIAGVMGGAESEVSERTRSVLLEGAAWNFINIRRTATAQRLASEAAYRFSRGVHPAMAERGVRRGLELMRAWAGGQVAQGLVDDYPLPPVDPTVMVTPQDVERWLGVRLSPAEIANLLYRLDFTVEIQDQTVSATTPDFRMDINTGIVGVADLIEEIARIYGYDRIPETRLADELPPQRGNPSLEGEERVRDLLTGLGLQEVVTYRMTSPEREARRLPDRQVDPDYVRLLNPIASDRNVLRKNLVSSVLEVVERNARLSNRIALFEIGPVFIPAAPGDLPEEPARLAISMTGPRAELGWQPADSTPMDFYDLKGVVDALLSGLHLEGVHYEPAEDPTFHPGKCARVLLGDQVLGIFGELHPIVREHYEAPPTPLLSGEFDLQAIIEPISPLYDMRPVSAFPPVLEDLAVIVDETVPAGRVVEVIRQAGGATLTDVRLFDVYRGEQIGAGKKSLAYSLTYQVPDRTLTDQEVLQIRQRIIRRLDQELSAKIRS
ncbi:MAG TPA: phenylalanine--tRNA ligase subunit beta [Anaerolineales bacterium]